MTSMTIVYRALPLLMALTVLTGGAAYAQEQWVPLTGEETLREFVSNARAEIELKAGVVAIGEYFADGTATIEAWGDTYERTWEVRGDDQVCYSSATETQCYTFEQNLNEPGEYRARHVETSELTVFRVSETDPRVVSRDTQPDSQGGLGSPSAAEIAAELSNPNNTLGTMNFFLDYTGFDGTLPDASSQNATVLLFQPSLPYPLSDATNLFIRPAIPLILRQDIPDPDGDRGFDSKEVNLGDIGFDALVGKSFENSMTLLGGLVGTLPTGTGGLSQDNWMLGPSVALATVRNWGVVGVLISHQWDIAGDGDSTSTTGGQYFYVIHLGGGWQISASPRYSYNHNADSDNALAFPVATGIAKTSIVGGRPWRFSLQYSYYAASPDLFGPRHQIRFQAGPVVALPW